MVNTIYIKLQFILYVHIDNFAVNFNFAELFIMQSPVKRK